MSTHPQPKYIPWSQVEREKLNDLIDREMVVGDKLMLARVFLNRMSDLLFIFARSANAEAGRAEPLWRPGGGA